MLDRAVLDLVDNSIDGARRLRPCPGSDLSGLRIDITLGRNGFSIDDNCGGIGLDLARTYAFRIGRSKSRPRTPNAIGEFGVGMKRALFNFGHEFTVTSRTLNDRFKLVVDVDAWEADDNNWSFRFEDFEDGLQTPEKDIGTLVEVSRLRDNVADTFDLLTFRNNLAREIARGQQEYLDRGLLITFNNVSCPSSPWTLLSSVELSPVSRMDTIKVGNEDVHTRIFAGISAPNQSSPAGMSSATDAWSWKPTKAMSQVGAGWPKKRRWLRPNTITSSRASADTPSSMLPMLGCYHGIRQRRASTKMRRCTARRYS